MFFSLLFALLAHVLIQLQLHSDGYMPTHRSKTLVRHSLNRTHNVNCSVRARTISGLDVCQCQEFTPQHGLIPNHWTDETVFFKDVKYTLAFDKNRISSRLPTFYTKLKASRQKNFLVFFRVIVPWYQVNTVDARATRIANSQNVLDRIPIREIPFATEWWNQIKKRFGWTNMRKWVTMLKSREFSVIKACGIADASSAR